MKSGDVQEEFAPALRRNFAVQGEGLWRRMSEAERQADELFQALLSESFGG